MSCGSKGEKIPVMAANCPCPCIDNKKTKGSVSANEYHLSSSKADRMNEINTRLASLRQQIATNKKCIASVEKTIAETTFKSLYQMSIPSTSSSTSITHNNLSKNLTHPSRSSFSGSKLQNQSSKKDTYVSKGSSATVGQSKCSKNQFIKSTSLVKGMVDSKKLSPHKDCSSKSINNFNASKNPSGALFCSTQLSKTNSNNLNSLSASKNSSSSKHPSNGSVAKTSRLSSINDQKKQNLSEFSKLSSFKNKSNTGANHVIYNDSGYPPNMAQSCSLSGIEQSRKQNLVVEHEDASAKNLLFPQILSGRRSVSPVFESSSNGKSSSHNLIENEKVFKVPSVCSSNMREIPISTVKIPSLTIGHLSSGDNSLKPEANPKLCSSNNSSSFVNNMNSGSNQGKPNIKITVNLNLESKTDNYKTGQTTTNKAKFSFSGGQ